MIWLNVLRSQPLVFDQVPLSCVPPITSHDRNGLIATFSNCRVLLRLRSVWSSTTGALESSRLQPTLSAPVTGPPVTPLRPVSSHCAERSANVPLVRMIPPSDPSKIWVGLPGFTTIACWSGWIPSGARRQKSGGVSPYGSYEHHG